MYECSASVLRQGPGPWESATSLGSKAVHSLREWGTSDDPGRSWDCGFCGVSEQERMGKSQKGFQEQEGPGVSPKGERRKAALQRGGIAHTKAGGQGRQGGYGGR